MQSLFKILAKLLDDLDWEILHLRTFVCHEPLVCCSFIINTLTTLTEI